MHSHYQDTMPPFTRHFFSQKLGRAIGTVHIDATGKASVEITFADNTAPDWRQKFCLEHSPDVPLEYGMEELALRIAVANLHRQAVKSADGESEPFSLGIRPWIGDFTAGPGGNSSLAAGGTTPQYERRERGHASEQVVASGIALLSEAGLQEARSFLRYAKVPPSVIRRVLSKSRHRRKSGAHPPVA